MSIHRPVMALGQRMLFFVTDKNDFIKNSDAYSLSLDQPAAWQTASEHKNLGLSVNSFYDDFGISYFSEYTGLAFFDKIPSCSGQLDIWSIDLENKLFPNNAMRLAGLVIDQNGEPVSNGFMEFTANYQLNVHAQDISKTGSYAYTVADSTEVVRLFPEVPGYYSERDTTHFLSKMPEGQITRDTFVVTSFDYIRKNFKLKHSTFYNGTAQFDQANKSYPELTRLAKIAVRMGAELLIIGHTDNSGSATENQALSLARAQAVKDFLTQKCGLSSDIISIIGKGSSQPICSNDTEEGRRCNRRIDIIFKMPEVKR